MTLKEQIKEKQEKIDKLESKITELENLIKKSEKELNEHQSRQSLGVTQLLLDIVQPIATYNALDGSLQSISSMQDLNKLKTELNSLKTDLNRANSSLEKLTQQEYNERKEAKLVSDENGIYIHGDESKTNLTEPLTAIINTYVESYNKLLETPEVEMYARLSNEIAEITKQATFPEATPDNIRELENIRPNVGCPFFEIKTFNNKIVVNKDFVTTFVSNLNARIQDHEKIIEEYKQKFANLKPNFLGKIFKNIGEKQTQIQGSKIEEDIKLYETKIQQMKEQANNIQKLKDKYITPSEEAIKKTNKLIELEDDSDSCYYVNKYKKHGAEYEQNIQNNTILKTSNKDLFNLVYEKIKPVLDSQDVKLSKENLFEELCKNKNLKQLSAEVENALGYNPLQKQQQPE